MMGLSYKGTRLSLCIYLQHIRISCVCVRGDWQVKRTLSEVKIEQDSPPSASNKSESRSVLVAKARVTHLILHLAL